MTRINKLKRGYNNPNLIFYDIETYVVNDKMVFRLGVVTCENISFACYDTDTFTWLLLAFTEKRKSNMLIAHNAQFDFSLLNHDYFNDFQIRMFSTQPFIVHYVHRDNHKHNTNVIFIDSLSFFKNTLDEIGKMFGKEKILVDVLRNFYDSEIEYYCVRDTQIINDAMNFINDQAIKYDIPFPVTFAQMSFLIYKRHFLKFSLLPPSFDYIMSLERDAYFGGRVEVFNFSKSNATIFDINSLYPFVMANNYFPISIVGYFSRDNCFNNQEAVLSFVEDKLYKKELIIAKVRVKINECFVAPIPKRIKDKIIFPIGTFETTLCTPELLLVKDNILEILEVTHYARDKIFSDYVDTFYSERKLYDSKHPNNLFYKLLMNSLYGKFGQRRFEFKRFEKFDDMLKYGAMDLDVDNSGELIRIEFFNGKAYRKDTFLDNERAFVAIAAFVTSYARVDLYKSLIANLDIIKYCDTDSMIVTGVPKQIILGDKLGQWKNDGDYTNFECLGNKHYRADGLLKVKGVPKSAKVISDYVFEFEKITKMKESIIRFKEPIPRVIQVTKHYKGTYDKRIIHADKTTIPITFQEFVKEQVSLT